MRVVFISGPSSSGKTTFSKRLGIEFPVLLDKDSAVFDGWGARVLPTTYVLDGEGSYSMDYMPGLSGVAHQAGHYSNIVTQEPGDQVGKRLWQLKTQGMVVGCEALDDGHLVVNVKSGFVDEIEHAG